jgi:hypothetical protein
MRVAFMIAMPFIGAMGDRSSLAGIAMSIAVLFALAGFLLVLVRKD